MYFGQVVTAYGKLFWRLFWKRFWQSCRICLFCANYHQNLWLWKYVLFYLPRFFCRKSNPIPEFETQLFSIPPWAAAFCFSMFIAFVSDRLRHRYAFTLIPMLIAIAGYAILLNINGEHHTQYGALFLVTSGCYSAMPVIVCWFTMNLGGHRRRSIGTAWQIGFGNSE